MPRRPSRRGLKDLRLSHRCEESFTPHPCSDCGTGVARYDGWNGPGGGEPRFCGRVGSVANEPGAKTMQRLFLAVALLAVACGSGRSDEDKKDKKPASMEDLKEELGQKFRAAEGKEAKEKLLKEYVSRFLEVAEKGGKSEDALEAISLTIRLGARTGEAAAVAKAKALLRKNHLDNKNLASMLPMLAGAMGDEAAPLLKEVMEKGANDKIKAAACQALLEAKERELEEATGNAAEKIKKEMAELRKTGVEKYKMKDLFVGGTLPDLTSENLEGKKETLSQYKGKVVVLDLWATWCPPCRAMIPHERELVDRLKDKPFKLISVSFDDEKETLMKFLEKEKMPWVHWFNGRKGDIGEKLNVKFFPTIFVLDAKGVIRYKGVRNKDMDRAVDTLLKEMADEKK